MAYFKELSASPQDTLPESNGSRVDVDYPEHDHAPGITELWTDLMGRMAIRGLQMLLIGVVVVCVVIGLPYVSGLNGTNATQQIHPST